MADRTERRRWINSPDNTKDEQHKIARAQWLADRLKREAEERQKREQQEQQK